MGGACHERYDPGMAEIMRQPPHDDTWQIAMDVAGAVVDAFSELHPNIRMNRQQWADLREMIEREIRGEIELRPDGEAPIRARDLLKP